MRVYWAKNPRTGRQERRGIRINALTGMYQSLEAYQADAQQREQESRNAILFGGKLNY